MANHEEALHAPKFGKGASQMAIPFHTIFLALTKNKFSYG